VDPDSQHSCCASGQEKKGPNLISSRSSLGDAESINQAHPPPRTRQGLHQPPRDTMLTNHRQKGTIPQSKLTPLIRFLMERSGVSTASATSHDKHTEPTRVTTKAVHPCAAVSEAINTSTV
jgi:hypothetical protein